MKLVLENGFVAVRDSDNYFCIFGIVEKKLELLVCADVNVVQSDDTPQSQQQVHSIGVGQYTGIEMELGVSTCTNTKFLYTHKLLIIGFMLCVSFK